MHSPIFKALMGWGVGIGAVIAFPVRSQPSSLLYPEDLMRRAMAAVEEAPVATENYGPGQYGIYALLPEGVAMVSFSGETPKYVHIIPKDIAGARKIYRRLIAEAGTSPRMKWEPMDRTEYLRVAAPGLESVAGELFENVLPPDLRWGRWKIRAPYVVSETYPDAILIINFPSLSPASIMPPKGIGHPLPVSFYFFLIPYSDVYWK